MPSNKKKTKRRISKSTAVAKKSMAKKRPVEPRRSKKSPKKKAAKAIASRARGGAVNRERESKQEIRSRNSTASNIVSGRQSGDLEGVSQAEQADSESVEELLEEGNVSEASAVAGVEESENVDEKEVRTHELPEDDVPEEYLDED